MTLISGRKNCGIRNPDTINELNCWLMNPKFSPGGIGGQVCNNIKMSKLLMAQLGGVQFLDQLHCLG
jgi:hypothetical protein